MAFAEFKVKTCSLVCDPSGATRTPTAAARFAVFNAKIPGATALIVTLPAETVPSPLVTATLACPVATVEGTRKFTCCCPT